MPKRKHRVSDSAVASGHSPNVEQLPGFLSRCDSSYDYGETPCNGIWWEDGKMTGGCGDACSFVMQKAGCGVPPFLSDDELLREIHKLMLRKSRGWN